MKRKFLVHAKQDLVAVAVDDIEDGEEIEGVIMDDGGKIPVKSRSSVLLGHKIALADIKKGENVIGVVVSLLRFMGAFCSSG